MNSDEINNQLLSMRLVGELNLNALKTKQITLLQESNRTFTLAGAGKLPIVLQWEGVEFAWNELVEALRKEIGHCCLKNSHVFGLDIKSQVALARAKGREVLNQNPFGAASESLRAIALELLKEISACPNQQGHLLGNNSEQIDELLRTKENEIRQKNGLPQRAVD